MTGIDLRVSSWNDVLEAAFTTHTGTRMSLFEYLMVMVSIILGLSITQVLRGLSKIARSRKRSVVVTIYAVFLFGLHVQVWWALWDLSVVPEWNFVFFLLLISIPSVLFATTELLFPMATTAETDWNAHYESVRKWFLSVLLLWSVLALLETRIFIGVPFTHPYRIVQLSIISLIAVGILLPGRRAQVWLAGSILFLLVAGQLVFRLVPGLA